LGTAGFNDGNLEPCFREALGGPAAGGAGADYEDIEIGFIFRSHSGRGFFTANIETRMLTTETGNVKDGNRI
jgi:hypothetical protein